MKPLYARGSFRLEGFWVDDCG